MDLPAQGEDPGDRHTGAGTATLLPDRNEGFTIKEEPTTSIQFVTGNDGKVDEFALSGPAGVFNFKRKAK